MADRPKKVVLFSRAGYKPELDELVAEWMARGVSYVGVVGVDASHIEDIIDELVVGDGSNDYDLLTASQESPATLEDAKSLAAQLSGEFAGAIEVVEL